MINKKKLSIIIVAALLLVVFIGAAAKASAETVININDIKLENNDDNFAYGLFGKGQTIALAAAAIVVLSVCVICTTGLIRKK